MFEPKAISADAIPRALARAEHYRLLNEPRDAESICRDIVAVDPDHQAALITLLLALTDQFGRGRRRVNLRHAEELLPRLSSDYERVYYAGVVYERWAKHLLEHTTPGNVIFDWFRRAMNAYETAEAQAPDGNDDAKLRWNACARIIASNEQIRPAHGEHGADAMLQDDVPMR